MEEVKSWGNKKLSFMKVVKLICDSDENSNSFAIRMKTRIQDSSFQIGVPARLE